MRFNLNLQTLRRLVAAWAICLFYSVSLAYAQTLHVTDDAEIDLNVASRNAGSSGKCTVNVDKVCFVRFDLGTLPSGITGDDIDKAILKMFADNVSMGGAVRISAVEADWDERTLIDNTAPAFDTESDTSIGFGVATGDEKSYVSRHITELVQQWVDGVTPNYGIALDIDIFDADVAFETKESGISGHPMVIDVVLTQPN